MSIQSITAKPRITINRRGVWNDFIVTIDGDEFLGCAAVASDSVDFGEYLGDDSLSDDDSRWAHRDLLKRMGGDRSVKLRVQAAIREAAQP